MKILFLVTLIFSVFSIFSQQKKIDSIYQLLSTQPEDTVQINSLIKLGYQLKTDSVQKAHEYALQARQLAKKTGYKTGLARSYSLTADLFKNESKYETAIACYDTSITLFGELKIQFPSDRFILRNLARSYKSVGNCYYYLGLYEEAVQNVLKSSEISEQIGDTDQVGQCILTIGSIHNAQENWDEALKVFHQVIEIAKSTNDIKLEGTALNNIGATYGNKKEYDKAEEYFAQGLELHKKAGNMKGYSFCLNNLGLIYRYKNAYEKSLQFLNEGLQIRLKLGNKYDIAISYISIAYTYNAMSDYKTAMEYLKKAMDIALKINALYVQREVTETLSDIYYKTGNLKDAYHYQVQFKKLSDSLVNTENSHKISKLKIQYEFNKKQKILEIEHARKEELAKATISKQKILRNAFMALFALMIIFSFIIYRNFRIKKKANEMLEMQKKQIIEINEELLQQKEEMLIQAGQLEKVNQQLEQLSIVASKTDNAIIIAGAEGNILWVNEAFTRIYGYTLSEFIKQKGSNLFTTSNNPGIAMVWQQCIEKKKSVSYITLSKTRYNTELWIQTTLTPVLDQSGHIEKLVAVDADITKIKIAEEAIEKHNKDITDSIKYASHIQEAMLPTKNLMNNAFPHHFILNIPRDIVSGDFYWAMQTNQQVMVAVGDCTGHGVPGAFMSVLGMAFLKEVASQLQQPEAATVLNLLREKVIQSLHQLEKESETKDGIDLALCIFDFQHSIMQFAGGNRNGYLVHKGTITELQPDCFPIGIHEFSGIPFTNHTFHLSPGDTVYLASDGFVDQFGGTLGRKFMSKRYRQLLLDIQDKSMDMQETIMKDEFYQWKRQYQQVDDVLVLGIRY